MRLLVFLALFFAVFNIQGQTHGVIYDFESKAPLSGAHVVTSKASTITNSSGVFNLNVNAEIVIVSHLGYNSDTIFITGENQNIAIYLKPNFKNLEQIVVQATQHNYKLMQLPSSVSLLLLDKPDNNIGYVEQLNQAPGVFVHNGTLNTNRITIRGMGSRTPYSSNRVKAYYNGIPVTGGDGSTEIEDINAQSINSIEILKGSKSGIYGAGLGGVILLKSKKIAKNGLQGSAEINAGSYSLINPNVNLSYKKNNFTIAAGIAYAENEGWRQNNGYQRVNFNALANYETEKSNTQFVLQYLNLDAGIPSSINENTFNNAPDSAAQNWLNVKGFEDYYKILTGVNHQQKLGSSFKNSTIIFANYYNGYESRPFNILDDEAIKGGIKNTLTYSKQNFEVLAGFETMYENYQWKTYETDFGTQGNELNYMSEQRLPVNLFTSTSLKLVKNIILEVGASYNFLSYTLTDYNKINQDLSGSYNYSPVLSPFAGVNVTVAKNWNIYTSISHGYSAPSLEETLMPDGALNTNIKPETGINAEFGLRFSDSKGFAFIDAGVYKIWLSDLLVTQRESEEVFYGINAGKTEHLGFEFSGNISLNKNEKYRLPQTNLKLSYNLSSHKFTEFTNKGISYKGNALPGIPKQNFWASAIFKYNNGLAFAYEIKYAGEQFMNDANSAKYNAYLLNQAKFSYSFKSRLEFSIAMQNIFNVKYASMLLVNAPSFGGKLPRYYYPGMSRNLLFSIRYRI